MSKTVRDLPSGSAEELRTAARVTRCPVATPGSAATHRWARVTCGGGAMTAAGTSKEFFS